MVCILTPLAVAFGSGFVLMTFVTASDNEIDCLSAIGSCFSCIIYIGQLFYLRFYGDGDRSVSSCAQEAELGGAPRRDGTAGCLTAPLAILVH